MKIRKYSVSLLFQKHNATGTENQLCGAVVEATDQYSALGKAIGLSENKFDLNGFVLAGKVILKVQSSN